MTRTGAYKAHILNVLSASSDPFRQDLRTSVSFIAACQAMMADVALKAFQKTIQALPTTIGANLISISCFFGFVKVRASLMSVLAHRALNCLAP